MLENTFRPAIQAFAVDPCAKLCARCGVTPVMVSFAALALGAGAALAVAQGAWLAALVCLLASGYLDIVDGSLARLTGQSTPLGCMIDIVSDRVVEVLMVLAFYSADPSRAWLSLLMLSTFLLCITSFLVVAALTNQQSEKSFYYSPGLIERAECFIFFAFMICVPSYFDALAWLLIALTAYTGVKRCYDFARSPAARGDSKT